MKSTHTAVEVTEPGVFRIVERPAPSREPGRCGLGWKLAESVRFPSTRLLSSRPSHPSHSDAQQTLAEALTRERKPWPTS